MLKILESLKGKKTYATAVATIAAATAAYFGGEITVYEGSMSIVGALLAIFLRNGMSTEAKK